MGSFSKNQIYSTIFTSIVEGNYKRNERLKEAQLAKDFGVSRTPIREVLQQLAQDGMVEIIPNRGAIVKPLTPDDIEEIYEIRKHLELLALDFAIHRLNLDRLSELKERITSIPEIDNFKEASESDRELHRYIIESSHKKRLINMVNQLLRLMQHFRYIGFHDPEITKRVTGEHLELIDALILRDLGKAKMLLADHLENSKKATLHFIFNREFING